MKVLRNRFATVLLALTLMLTGVACAEEGAGVEEGVEEEVE